MGTLLSLFWIKLKITFKFISPLILREQRHTHCNFIFLLSSMWRNWLRRPCIHRHRDRYSSINLSLIFQIRNKIQIFIPKTPSMLSPPTPLAPGHPADTPFFLLVSCWPFQDHKSTWADFAWATFPLSPFLGLWKCVGQGLVHRISIKTSDLKNKSLFLPKSTLSKAPAGRQAPRSSRLSPAWVGSGGGGAGPCGAQPSFCCQARGGAERISTCLSAL